MAGTMQGPIRALLQQLIPPPHTVLSSLHEKEAPSWETGVMEALGMVMSYPIRASLLLGVTLGSSGFPLRICPLESYECREDGAHYE